MSGWTLRRRFTVAAAGVTVLLVVLSGVVAAAFAQQGRYQREVVVSFFTAVRGSAELLNAYLDQETGVRGYVLTGEASMLDTDRSGQEKAERELARLRELLRANERLLALADEVEGAARDWRAQYAGPVVERVRAAGPSAADAPAQERGRGLFERLRAVHTRFSEAVLASRNASAEQLEAGRRALAASFAVLALVVVAAGLALGHTLRRWILRPLDAVGNDARAVAAGDLDHPVRASGPPELADLAADVERMRGRLIREYRAVRAANRTVELQRARLQEQTEELRRSNAELEQFAYVASHDLQEPLRKVASFTDLLRRRYRGTLDERADTYIDFAVDGARRMQALINDLLAFSRVGRVGSGWGTANLADAAAAALRDLEPVVEETGATVEVEPLPTVPGDAALLRQVFQNLIGNALKFRRPDVAPVVRVCARPDPEDPDGAWQVDVVDNGIGVDPAYADRIFVIFTRLGRREDYPGSGIGLAMAKKIVEYHGGRIWLGEHHDSPGATMSFVLPSTDRRVIAAGVEDLTAATPAGTSGTSGTSGTGGTGGTEGA